MNFDLPRDKEAFLRHSGWEFSLSHCGTPFQVSSDEIDGLPDDQELAFFKETVAKIIERTDEVLQSAVDRYWAEYNQLWNPTAPVSNEEFRARLKLSGVYIGAKGSVEVELEDAHDMFRGHAIIVSFGRDMQITAVDLAG